MPAAFELHRLGGVEGVYCVTTPRFGVGDAIGGLLDGLPQPPRQVMTQTAALPSPIRQEERDGGHQAPGEYDDPNAQPGWVQRDLLPCGAGKASASALLHGKAYRVCDATEF